MNTFLAKLLSNKHTTGAALVYLFIELGQQVATVWFPHYADQIYETSRIISKGVVGYGLIMAGDAKPEKQLTPPTDEPKS